jgi:hypothetical protein
VTDRISKFERLQERREEYFSFRSEAKKKKFSKKLDIEISVKTSMKYFCREFVDRSSK